MNAEKVDIDYLRTWVGREQRVTDSLPLFPARALAAALDHEHLPENGDALPPTWHWLYFLDTPTAAGTGSDGHPHKGGFLPPVPLPRRMWAAGALNIAQALRLGVSAEKVSTVRSVELKDGKSGTLVFVNLEHRLYQQGQLCISEEQNLVYRAMPDGPALLPAGELAPQNTDWSRTLQPDPVLLFRFSALTYNGHRIHYDRDYAMQKEFYPGLVVHGPLLATLLVDLVLREKPDATINQFRFRAVRPTFDMNVLHLRGQRDGNTIQLCSADHENYLGMTATAVLGHVL
jgi:3-methylfumaryl-CoA hydratase